MLSFPSPCNGLLCPPLTPNPSPSHRGRYHTDRQPSARQLTITCPAVPRPPAAASAASHRQCFQLTITRPGPHGCPCSHAAGYSHQSGSRTSTHRFEHSYKSS
jgi:hypothetical protein